MNRLFSLERSLHGSQTRLRKLKEMHRSFTAPNEVPDNIYNQRIDESAIEYR